MAFVVGAIASLFLFVPVLIVALTLANTIYKHVLAFVLLGPIIVSALIISFGGIEFGGLLSVSPIVSSVVFFGLSRLDNPITYLAED